MELIWSQFQLFLRPKTIQIPFEFRILYINFLYILKIIFDYFALFNSTNIHIPHSLKGFMSQTPYLVEDTPIAPHITGCRVLLVMNSFGGCPLQWYLPTS